MTAQAWEIAIWVFGSVCIVGCVAAWILFPAVFSMVLKGVVAFFQWVLGYRLGCALVAAIVVGLAVDYVRHSHDDAVYAKRVEAFNAAQDARDARIAGETRERVTKELAEVAKADTATDQEVKEFKDALPPVVPETGNPFRVGADACRLRHIAGEARCEPVVVKGVPKAKSASKRPAHWGGLRLPRPVGASPRSDQQSQ